MSDEYTLIQAESDTHTARIAHRLRALEHAVTDLGKALEDGIVHVLADDRGRKADVATFAALATVQRQRLQGLENDLATALGQHAGRHIGTLADGSRYEVARSADRKAWDHDDWKRDVRREVVAQVAGPLAGGTLQHTNLETGEVTETTLGRILQEALTLAQNVHGSQAPKSAALRTLGLTTSDYCDSTPGPWRVSFIKPDTTTPPVTATPKD